MHSSLNKTMNLNFRIEINAGKCIYDGNMLKPDKRRGKLILYKGIDSLFHVQWVCRENNKIEDDLIVMDDAYLEKINSCKTGRVYLMKFIYSGKSMFFWMQDADESKDIIFVNEFNRTTGCIPSALKNKEKQQETNRKQEINRKQETNKKQEINRKQETNINQETNIKKETNINIAELSNSLISKLKSIQKNEQTKGIVFSDFFKTEHFIPLLEIPEVVDELKNYMPEGYQTKEDILNAVTNKLLDGNLQFFDSSLITHFNFVLSSLNIPFPEREVNDPMEYLVENLEKKYEEKKVEKEVEKKVEKEEEKPQD